MRSCRGFLPAAAIACALLAGCAWPWTRPGPAAPARLTLPLDAGWRFLQSDAQGAEQAAFDDSGWRTVDVPHDWAIAGPFDPKSPAKGEGAFLPAGIGWYRRHLGSDPSYSGRRVFIEFDAVMANSDVWVNGVLLGHRPYGYSSFAYELTGHLAAGGDNVIAVRADNSRQVAARWYTGSGIIRHVRLVIEDPVHIERNSTFITTPVVTASRAVVHMRTTVVNESADPAQVSVVFGFSAPGGGAVQVDHAQAPTGPSEIAAGKSADFEADLPVANPALWDLGSPALYRASVDVDVGGKPVDTDAVTFGIRDARFEAATGFWLNGRNLKLKGVCVHGDGGAFGGAVPLGVWRRRLEALRALGTNAIRTAHNPPDPGFLDLCDRMGFLVMDEAFDCWRVAKRPYDYHLYFDEWSKTDAADMVRRDRNHPSIVIWSAGNEIHDSPRPEAAKKILASLLPVFHGNDPTRPVTVALVSPDRSHDYDDGFADMQDVIGTNYREALTISEHAKRPGRRIVGTENHQTLDAWRAVRDNAFLAGQFLWVGIDYLGESPRWPFIGGGGDQSGLLDRTGAPYPSAFQRQSWWSSVPMVRIARRVAPEGPVIADPGQGTPPRRRPDTLLSDWTPEGAGPHVEAVEVYSNAESVELLLNGRSLGVKPNDPAGAPCLWQVPFEEGSLKAVASTGGRVVATHELRTAGAPARVALEADCRELSPGWDEVGLVRATVVDAAGTPVPGASPVVTFRVDGPGTVAAVDNADNSSHEPFQAAQRSAYRGRCVAFVRATGDAGTITITASADGLADGRVAIEAAAPPH
jgi:beta-galactosidase